MRPGDAWSSQYPVRSRCDYGVPSGPNTPVVGKAKRRAGETLEDLGDKIKE